MKNRVLKTYINAFVVSGLILCGCSDNVDQTDNTSASSSELSQESAEFEEVENETKESAVPSDVESAEDQVDTTEKTSETEEAESSNKPSVEIIRSGAGMPSFEIADHALHIVDEDHIELAASLDEILVNSGKVEYSVYRSDDKVFSVRENRSGGFRDYYNFNMNGELLSLEDVIYDFPASCTDILLNELEDYQDQYGALWRSDFDISEISYDNVGFNLDINSVVIYINDYPYRIYYKENASIINPDVMPNYDSPIFGLMKNGELNYSNDSVLYFNYLDSKNSMELLSLNINSIETNVFEDPIYGYASAYYYFDGKNRLFSVYNQGHTDEDFGIYLYSIADEQLTLLEMSKDGSTLIDDVMDFAR